MLSAGLALGIGLLWPRHPAVAPTTNTANANNSVSNTSTSANTTVFSTADLPDRDSHFSFSLSLPSPWVVEYIGDSKAINFFDLAGQTQEPSLAESKVFVQYYEANDFQPSTYSTTPQESVIAGQPARQYQYQVPDSVQFTLAPGYPVWVVTKNHQLIHVRTGQGAPYTFLVFHQSPEVADTVFATMIQSLRLGAEMR